MSNTQYSYELQSIQLPLQLIKDIDSQGYQLLIANIKLQINHGSWMPSLDLTIYDKGCIEMEDGLLTNKHMLAASKLLKRQFPGLQGLQSTLLSETDGFSPISLEQNAGFVLEGE